MEKQHLHLASDQNTLTDTHVHIYAYERLTAHVDKASKTVLSKELQPGDNNCVSVHVGMWPSDVSSMRRASALMCVARSCFVDFDRQLRSTENVYKSVKIQYSLSRSRFHNQAEKPLSL